MTTILGIDPGSRKTGFGVIRTEGSAAVYVTSGIIRLPVDQPLGPRLGVLFSSLNSIIDEFRPEELAIEEVFLARNPDSALKLGHARGAAMAACVHRGMDVYEYAARQIKLAVVGTGAASKEQVQHMVKILLKLPAAPKEDAADGLAAALCHLHSNQSLQHIPATARSRGRSR
ncbi:crossover junction endodeoxyribonuclease RuvC [Luminiphilus sp. nBUS_07]|uniref:crossover junction endodeoxyribonuclease RuvC n=1 Tax=Luminiphilus sp. nBUS_07 TaxID=3395314 RepID=UPI003EC00DC5